MLLTYLLEKGQLQETQSTSRKCNHPPPDPSNPEDQEWMKTGQGILGYVLWL